MNHRWYLDENGKVDDFRMDAGYCNGPECSRCEQAFCRHCESSYSGRDIYTEECPGDRYQQMGQMTLFSEEVA